MITKAIGVILILATIAAGIWVDIVWLFVAGITEIVHGAEVHPVSGSLIGWGAVHLLCTSAGVTVAVLLCMLWAALFFGRSPQRRRAGVRVR